MILYMEHNSGREVTANASARLRVNMWTCESFLSEWRKKKKGRNKQHTNTLPRVYVLVQCTHGCRDTPTHGPRLFKKKRKEKEKKRKRMPVHARAKRYGSDFLAIESRTCVITVIRHACCNHEILSGCRKKPFFVDDSTLRYEKSQDISAWGKGGNKRFSKSC